jgi:hypothetical protein
MMGMGKFCLWFMFGILCDKDYSTHKCQLTKQNFERDAGENQKY